MQEAIAVQIKVSWSYWSLLGCFTVPQSRQTQQDGFNWQQKAVIENDFNEKGWNAYKIWKEHPSFECSPMAVHNLSKTSRGLGRQSAIKEAADPLPQQKKTRWFFRSLFVRKKINLVPTIPSDILHLGYRSANHQFITWSRKRIFIATNV